MKRNLPARYVLSIAAACLLGAFSVAPLSGCAAFAKIEHAVASPATVTSLKVTGASVDFAMQVAATMYVKKEITATQWATIASLHDDKFIPVFNAAVAAVTTSNRPSPANVIALGNDVISAVDALRK